MLGTFDLTFRITAIATINITIEMSLQTIWRWKYCPNNYRGKKKIQNMKQHQFEKFKRRWNRSKKCPATSHSSKHTKNQNSRKSLAKRKGKTHNPTDSNHHRQWPHISQQTQSQQQYYCQHTPFSIAAEISVVERGIGWWLMQSTQPLSIHRKKKRYKNLVTDIK